MISSTSSIDESACLHRFLAKSARTICSPVPETLQAIPILLDGSELAQHPAPKTAALRRSE